MTEPYFFLWVITHTPSEGVRTKTGITQLHVPATKNAEAKRVGAAIWRQRFFHKIDADSSLHKQQSAAQSPKTTATATITMTTTTSTSDDDSNDDSDGDNDDSDDDSNDDSDGDNDNDIASFLSSSGRIQRIRQSQKQEKNSRYCEIFC